MCRRIRRATSPSGGWWCRRSARVPRETVGLTLNRGSEAFHVKRVAERYGLDPGDRLSRLLDALAAEPDPPTTVREPSEAADVHIADSLVALEIPQLRQAQAIADIGAGAGFPGLALAVALPDARVDLIESSRRKCEVIERLASAAE